MHEIDPQSEHSLAEDTVSKALRHMARSSQQDAPAEIGVSLATAFRRHHRRRRVRRASIVGLVACIALIAGLMSLRTLQHRQSITQARIEIGSVPIKTPDAVITTAAVPVQLKPAHKRTQPKATTSDITYSRQFLALPGYDPDVPADELHVMRVQVPSSALWQMGAPVSLDGGNRKVLADFVVSQDGTPYAVRLVQ
jgi:hypothetical protein